MNSSMEIALKLFPNLNRRPCLCGGNHEVCLQCKYCRYEEPAQLPTDFDNLAQYIDHTALKPETTQQQIEDLCSEAEKFKVMAVCVNPVYVKLAKKLVNDIVVCSVVGFPLAASKTDIIFEETKTALEEGAAEIDMVIKANWLKDEKYEEVEEEIEVIAQLVHRYDAKLKVILENCVLTDEEKIKACLLAKKAGADFVKTSTGFNTSGATVEDVALMRAVVGLKVGVKAAGGIRTREQAISMLKAGANRIGASKTAEIVQN
jgi:deoxyribose-phosphate aldolase